MRSTGLFFCAALMTVAGACSSGIGPPPDGGSPDGITYDLALDLPPGCPPVAGNSLGVGAPCTRGGGQCAAASMPKGLVCTCDTIDGVTLNGVPCICTLAGLNPSTTIKDPCMAAKPNCGTTAVCCAYMSVAYYCTPNVCLPGGTCIDFSAADGGS